MNLISYDDADFVLVIEIVINVCLRCVLYSVNFIALHRNFTANNVGHVRRLCIEMTHKNKSYFSYNHPKIAVQLYMTSVAT